jgi:hypothetical protein
MAHLYPFIDDNHHDLLIKHGKNVHNYIDLLEGKEK